MKQFYLLFTLILFIIQAGFTQYTAFLYDDFTNPDKHKDLSVLIIRDGETEPSSAFLYEPKTDDNGLTFDAVHINPEASGLGGYNSGSYYTHTCIDYEFPEIDRTEKRDTIKIEFDAIWKRENTGSGESGRLVVHLIHEYPEGGPEEGDHSDNSENHYGRPAYNIRILNGSRGAYMAYGGGEDIDGAFEWHTDSENWLPGFSSASGGGTIGDMEQDGWPFNSWAKTGDGNIQTVSQTRWMHYTWIIAMERLELYFRPGSEGPEKDSLLLFMQIPDNPDNVDDVVEAHGVVVSALPELYNWWEYVNAVRFFFRNANADDDPVKASDCWLANVTMSKTGDPINTLVEFKRDIFNVDEGEGTYSLELEIFQESELYGTSCEVVLVSGDSTLLDNYETQAVTFEAGDIADKIIPITLSAGSGGNEFVFEIRNVKGGFTAIAGEQSSFTLHVIGGSSVGKSTEQEIKLYPNPATNQLQIEFGPLSGQHKLPVEIYTLTGQRVMAEMVKNNGAFNVSNLPAGTYFVKIYTRQGVVNRKIQIIH